MMKKIRHIQHALLATAFVTQLAMLFTGQPLLIALLPFILASFPLAYLALCIARMQNSPRPTIRGFVVVAALLWGIPAALSLLPEPSMKLDIARLIMIDGGILYASALLANLLQPKKRVS